MVGELGGLRLGGCLLTASEGLGQRGHLGICCYQGLHIVLGCIDERFLLIPPEASGEHLSLLEGAAGAVEPRF